ncbi:uncharacterized protein AMSG_11649 [Thecamonas trahens ATCC 50062]|uniref:EF-hand domain-containing protein n=1 Tax=Thecamonas trahens ATCC 50062 TaxID=461836 RepID=A0A0L0DN33_THETB|nr:hypothetical protein AMSG_11649 [Thecamonas trahens ATCC 50062]KNC53665.1 hypothetical protein AMSG_11649 [Thecamonas trahens ATCC 50062]|eukprot:XP_013762048.1 hypothetical protein AMSG_11649 [Thecamonas trahens ATCC 50062]
MPGGAATRGYDRERIDHADEDDLASPSASGLPPSPPSPVPNVALAATRGPLTVSQLEPESANDVMDTSADGYEYEYEVEYVYDADAEERLATPTEAVPRPPELSPIHNSPSRFEFVEEVYGVDESQVNYGVKLYEEAMRRRAAREAAVVASRAEAERSLTRDAFRPRLGPTAVSTQFQDPDFVTRLQRVSEYSQEQREALRAEVEDEVLAECTFEPRISAKSKQIMKRKEEQLAAKRAGHDPLASMLDRFNHYEAKRVDRLKDLIKLREEELEVTGSPAISAYSQAIERTDSLSVHERLYAKGAEHLKLRKMKSVALADRLYEEACQPKPVVHDIAVPSIKRDYDRTRLLVRAQRSALGVHEALYHEAKARQETKRKRELRAQFEEELLHAAPKMSAKSQAIIRSKLSAESVSKLFAQADVDETGDLSRDQVEHLFVELGWFVSRSVDKHKPRIQEEQAMLDSVWTHLDPDGTGRVEPESLHAFVDSVVESDPVLSSATPADVMARVHGAADSASDSGAVLDALMEADGKLAAAFAARPEIVQFVELIRTKSAYEALHRAPKTPVLDDDCTFQPQVMVTNRTAKLEAKALARLIVKNPELSRSPNRRHEIIEERAKIARRKAEVKRLAALDAKLKECTFSPKVNKYTKAAPPSAASGATASPSASKSSPARAAMKWQAKLSTEEREILEHCKFSPAIREPPRSILYPKASPLAKVKGVEKAVKLMTRGRADREEKRRLNAPLHDWESEDSAPAVAARSGKARRAKVGQAAEKRRRDSVDDTTSVVSDVSIDPILFVMDVNLGMGRSGKLGVRAGDDPAILAREFGAQYHLDAGMVRQLQVMVASHLESYLSSNYNNELIDIHKTLTAKAASDTPGAGGRNDGGSAHVPNAQPQYEYEYEYEFVDDAGSDHEPPHAALYVDRVAEHGSEGAAGSEGTSGAGPQVVLELSGEAREGAVLNAHEIFIGCDATGATRRWIRIEPATGTKSVMTTGSTELVVTGEMAGYSFLYQCQPVGGRWTSTPPVGPVSAQAPAVLDLAIEGRLMEGVTLRVGGQYAGGEEGASEIKWYARSKRSTSKNVLLATGRELPLSLTHVGMTLVVEYLPVRSDGEVGELASAMASHAVEPAPPQVLELTFGSELAASPQEGVELTPVGTYFGGEPAQIQQYRWYRIVPRGPDPNNAELLEIAGTKRYMPTNDDVNHFLKFVWTPVSASGRMGEAVGITTRTPPPPNEARRTATALFKLLNPELFIKPRRWVSYTGTAVVLGVVGYLYYHKQMMENDRAYRQKRREARPQSEIEDELEWQEEERRLAKIAARSRAAQARLEAARAYSKPGGGKAGGGDVGVAGSGSAGPSPGTSSPAS